MSKVWFVTGSSRGFGRQLVVAALERGDYARAAAEMLDSAWSAQVGDRASELADMMRTGRYAA